MKIKRFNENITITQQPFYLRKSDYLYISDDLAKSITPTVDDMIKKGWRYEFTDQRNKDFLNNIKVTNDRGFTHYKSNQITTLYQVKYGGNSYSMSITIRRGNSFNNEFGKFQYLIGGISGDYEMHGKNMVRATRECNLIRNAILKDPSIVKYGLPSELEEEFDHYVSSYKYNL